MNGLELRRRALMKLQNSNPEYTFVEDYIEQGNTHQKLISYHKYEVYLGNSYRTYGWPTSYSYYKNCEKMVSIEYPNYKSVSTVNWAQNGPWVGCTSLKKMRFPLGGQFGHYAFNGLDALEYLELGSIGNPWTGAGYYRSISDYDPFGNRQNAIGSAAGLTIVAYMTGYSATARFMGTVAANTTIIIRSAVTGEILTP